MSLYRISTVSIPVMYLENIHEYTQVCVQYPHISISHNSCVHLAELQFNLCTCKGVVYYYENEHLLRCRFEHTCTLAIYYQVDLLLQALYFKAKYVIDLKPDPYTSKCKRYDSIIQLTKTMDICICNGK